MSVEERNTYRQQLREIDSDDERGQFIAQHKEEMRPRAKAQGVTPDDRETEAAE
ncbi:MAG: hypothetical protein OEO82_05890 [Gammaproteobacteria bacterium]|nr:hypothetical protein [Gammaproteobacteria bacterium]